MSEEQSAGEAMAYGVIDQADRLAKSARMTQQALELQIEELIRMEARVNVQVARLEAATKGFDLERAKLEAERVKLQAIGPTLQQNAVWAMRETLREQGTQIKSEIRTEVMGALVEPLQDIHAGARHVRDNVRESTWLTKFSFVALGCALGLVVGYVPVRSDLNALVEHVNNIDHYLAAQQAPPAAAAPAPVPGKDHKGKGK